jgi:hypothetical protein
MRQAQVELNNCPDIHYPTEMIMVGSFILEVDDNPRLLLCFIESSEPWLDTLDAHKTMNGKIINLKAGFNKQEGKRSLSKKAGSCPGAINPRSNYPIRKVRRYHHINLHHLKDSTTKAYQLIQILHSKCQLHLRVQDPRPKWPKSWIGRVYRMFSGGGGFSV